MRNSIKAPKSENTVHSFYKQKTLALENEPDKLKIYFPKRDNQISNIFYEASLSVSEAQRKRVLFHNKRHYRKPANLVQFSIFSFPEKLDKICQ